MSYTPLEKRLIQPTQDAWASSGREPHRKDPHSDAAAHDTKAKAKAESWAGGQGGLTALSGCPAHREESRNVPVLQALSKVLLLGIEDRM